MARLCDRIINPSTKASPMAANAPATSGSDVPSFRWPHYEEVSGSYAPLLHCTDYRNRTRTKRFGSSCATTTLSRLALPPALTMGTGAMLVRKDVESSLLQLTRGYHI